MTTMQQSRPGDYIILGAFHVHVQSLPVKKREALPNAIELASAKSTWISADSYLLDDLITTAVSAQIRLPRFGKLFTLKPLRSSLFGPLTTMFKHVYGADDKFKRLPDDQLADVLGMECKANRFIGGTVDETTATLTLVRGNFETLVVPLSIFRSAGPSVPDFKRLAFDDYGYAIQFGPKYEASAHSVLYECDPDYRREYNKKRQQAEKGFGPSLRRLRRLRQLSRADFPGLAEKTIARIERGEARPHAGTLKKIARVLNVKPSEIESY
jgi:DNA-binding XRE family transcriptional regulator